MKLYGDEMITLKGKVKQKLETAYVIDFTSPEVASVFVPRYVLKERINETLEVQDVQLPLWFALKWKLQYI